ncbi:hypothetical protein ABL840_17535 [Variovorax sp. NFACC27]|uniref:hypothetical protein n=1 Tax=unclassified Variovorax TaxID=663243 RepID=UPI00089D0335|nr:hypothetical protein SAMN03159371_03318 [Variovorax sp. NFACC28]SEG70240.1 hypothetical protein SAMN03159365_03207 [Variovorax sp. NFACC29]SFC83003.1 hypothetical protein SAMN03159379_03287 [Variovorax sp. NFACC26]SFF98132.1 hypothetical protein SAMN03159447_01204 [Variovorax sp. NFACC27]
MTLVDLTLAVALPIHRNLRDARHLASSRRQYGARVNECSLALSARLTDGAPESIETSSQRLDQISDLERINFHICAISSTSLDADVQGKETSSSGLLVSNAEALRCLGPHDDCALAHDQLRAWRSPDLCYLLASVNGHF